MKHLITTLILASLPLIAAAKEWTPAKDADAYQKVLTTVKASESYSKFLATEKKSIPKPNAEYYQARWQYFRQLHIVNPKIASTGRAANQFAQLCVKKGWLKGNPGAFKNAAQIVGMELITDKNPIAIGLKGIKAHRDIAYANYKGFTPKLDLFLPEKTNNKPVPCIIFIHGGGWVVHKRAWFEGHARIAAREGFAAVTIDYRLLPGVTPLECVHDAKAAVRWIRANASKYGIDPEKIGACGASAGAHLATILATSPNVAELEGQGGNAKTSSTIQAAVGFATPALTGKKTWPISRHKTGSPYPAWFKKVSPYEHASAGDAPMLLIHGSKDNLVSPDEPKALQKKLTEAGVKCEVEFIPGKGHVFYMTEAISLKAIQFFKKNL